jgi:hypothetical protein
MTEASAKPRGEAGEPLLILTMTAFRMALILDVIFLPADPADRRWLIAS